MRIDSSRLLFVAFFLVLSACGGSNNGGTSANENADNTEQESDMVVSETDTDTASENTDDNNSSNDDNSGAVSEPSVSDGLAAGQPIDGQYIVLLNKLDSVGVLGDLGLLNLPLVDQLIGLLDTVGGTLLGTFSQVLSGFVAELSPEAAALLAANPLVALVEQDQTAAIAATQLSPPWGLDRIDQAALPLDNSYQYTGDGTGTHLYIIDTGIRSSHSDFSGRVGQSRNFVSSGFLFSSVDPEDFEDCNGHGTHVAGTAAGTTWGVAKGATIHALRVLGCGGSGSTSGIIASLDWLVANHQSPAVANMSLGAGSSEALDIAVRNAVAAGISVVVAAGNDNRDACLGSPNRVAEAVTVGATTISDSRSSFSNRGSCVDLFAPGSDIRSAWYTGDSAVANLSGTSMASPHVAGAAAILLGDDPGASPAEIFQQLLDVASTGKVSNVAGSPNLLLQAVPGEAGGDRLPVASFEVNCSDLSCDFDAAASSDDVAISSYAWQFGDGTSGNGVTISHSYADYGTYTATLTVTDSAAQSRQQQSSLVLEAPNSSPCPECAQSSGSLQSGGTDYQPGSNGFDASGGNFVAYLEGAEGTDFDIYLEKLTGFLFQSWGVVARAETESSIESISYNGSAGRYRWRVKSFNGAGEYLLYTNSPN